jgi:hypothetical protein
VTRDDRAERAARGSRIVALVEMAAGVLAAAASTSTVVREAAAFSALDVRARTRLAGVFLLTAAAAHTLVLIGSGASPGAVAWTLRALVAAIGWLAMVRPRAVSAAWRASLARRRPGRPA